MAARQLLRIAPVFLLFASGQLFAQSSIDAQMQKLEAAVKALEQRVASLESQLRERSAPASVVPSKANWRKLEKGMSANEVEQLLGSPSRVDTFSSFSKWNYASGGDVTFNDRGKVIGWSEPYGS